MNKINRIRIDGFRRLAHLDIKMRPFMTLIGANGVGKSSLLQAFSLLSASASGKLNESLSQYGGVSSLLTRDRSKDVSLLVDMDVPGHQPLEYELFLSPKGTGYGISKEILCQLREGHKNPFKHIDSSSDDIRYYEIGQGRLIRPAWEHNPHETSLSQVPKMFREPEEMRRILSNATEYHALDVGPRAPVKLPQQMKPATTPGASGEDLVSYLYYLRESDNDRFTAVLDAVHAAFPDFESLSFPPVAAGLLTMTWKDKKFTKPLYMNELSEGTLRFLWLVSLLESPALSTITMIDGLWCKERTHLEYSGLMVKRVPAVSKLRSMEELFAGRHFDREVIILCVRWYLRYKLSFRDLVEMMAERGLVLAHTTILRWVQRYTPEFLKRWNRYGRCAGRSWRVDETYIGSGANSQRGPR